MRKRILWILTSAMSVALMGLIFVQIKWIGNAVELKDLQFSQLVNSTLTDVSNQLETYYTSTSLNAIIEEKLLDSDNHPEQMFKEGPGSPQIILSEKSPEQIKIIANAMESDQDVVEIIQDSVIVITHKNGSNPDTIHISKYYDEQEKKRIEQSLQQSEVMVTAIMKKMLLEDVSFEKRVEQKQLEKILQKNLLDRGINLDYEYGVIRNNLNTVYTSGNFTKDTDYYYFRTGLLKDEIRNEETYLYLYFPGQRALVRGSMGLLGVSTGILTLVMVFLFTLALYVIFRQKKLSDIKNDFVNNMTHELKTPISTISLASQMLNDSSIPAEKKNSDYISRVIQAESKRLGYQVERVLQMAVLDQGHLVLKKGPVDMREIISNVVQNFELQVHSRSGKISFQDLSDSPMVFGDRVHLTNVLTNLLDNAIKYSRDKPEVSIELSGKNLSLLLSISDNGIGISKENQKKVFDKFFRVSTGNVHDVKGFGLGLSYVKLIIRQHDGTIGLSSELNKGTRFDIRLPLYNEKQT